MLSKKTQDILNTIENAFKIVSQTNGMGYEGSMKELAIDAMKMTAENDDKGYSTVASSASRGLRNSNDDNVTMEKFYQMLEDACLNKKQNHRADDLFVYLKESQNSRDDVSDIEQAYLDIWKQN